MKYFICYCIATVLFSGYEKTAKVTRIIDGDTFEIETGEKIRLIGINAPEMADIYGTEAKNHLSNLIKNRKIVLYTDYISNNRDRYQRLLRYVVLNNIDINKKMISDGYAFAYLKYRFSKSYDYEQAQLLSMSNKNGIWSSEKKQKSLISRTPSEFTWQILKSSKDYIIISLICALISIGLYSYFRR